MNGVGANPGFEGTENTAIGTSSLQHNTTGYSNTAIGHNALKTNLTGAGNIAIGRNALFDNTTGGSNIAIGGSSLKSNSDGFNNIGIGEGALVSNGFGDYNVGIGFSALWGNTNGRYCISIGTNSSYQNSSGEFNVAIGASAQYHNATGSNNTAIGSGSGVNPFSNPDNFTALGYNAGKVNSVSNRVEIGNTSVSWIGGQVGWSTYSDQRIKRNIQDNVPGLAFINQLRPVTYLLDIDTQQTICGFSDTLTWEGKYDIEQIVQSGFIAQEVEAAAQTLNYDFNGVTAPVGNSKLYSVSYSSFVVPLTKAVQELDAVDQALRKENENLKEEIARLRSEHEALRYLVNAMLGENGMKQ
jgi:hypothetical protein